MIRTLTGRISLRNLGFAILAVVTTGCSHDAAGPGGGGGGGGTGPAPTESPVYVSNSILAPSAGAVNAGVRLNNSGLGSMSIGVADANVAYISLPPQTAPGGVTAIVTNHRSRASVTTAMVDGGMDPIPIAAISGDSITIQAQSASGVTIATLSNSVPGRRRPKIVRTVPGRGKTGVPLNKNIEVVFTEPITQTSLSSSIRLFRGTAEVPGTATLLQGVTAAVVFRPNANLAPNTDYELVVTTGVRDLDGDAPDSAVRVPFTTGTSIVGPVASLSILPDRVDLRVGDQFQAVVVARDAAGNDVTGHGVRWSADSSAVEVTSTGLVTARHEGFGTVFAVVDGYGASIGVQVSTALHPVASVRIAFDSAGVATGGTLGVAAIAMDADGSMIRSRLVQWSSSNSAVATVDGTRPSGTVVSSGWFNGQVVPLAAIYWAGVSGVANGVAKIVATIEGQSDTLVVTVAPSLQTVGFVLDRDTATLLLHETARFNGASVNSGGGRVSVSASEVRWESSNAGVASIDAQGVITAVAPGTATIRAHWTNYSDSTQVTVVQVTFESISAGGEHSCALETGGGTYCWGANDHGQAGRPGVIGSGSPIGFYYPTPVRIADGFAFSALSTRASRSCGITGSGAAFCWGDNWGGALGSNNFDDSWRPAPVSGGLSFVEIDVGSNHTCAFVSSGAAYCWGNNYFGQLGTWGVTASPVPLAVSGWERFATLSAGSGHTCGLTSDGVAYCWGWNGPGLFSVGNPGSIGSPIPITGDLTFAQNLKFLRIAAGDLHTCGVALNGSVYCWGANFDGQLGTGTTYALSTAPARVNSDLTFSLVGAGASHACALDVGGNAYCWGRNDHGQLGIGSITSNVFATPQLVSGGFRSGGFTFDRLSVGATHNCARTTAGIWYCWGGNDSGQLGDGRVLDSGTPRKVLGQQ
jgi:alpha-tubulin suppressor-like RCC1 family protein/uncharacterized protein YjdB